MKNEHLPSPEKLSRELGEIRTTMDHLLKAYKAVYVASFRPQGGGSLGALGGKGSASDPTASAALSPEKNQLRYAARSIARSVHKAAEALERGEERGWQVFQELPGGSMREDFERKRDARREWRVHRWAWLVCGCARDDQGWWSVARSCSVHIALIPECDRAPFLASPVPSKIVRPTEEAS